MYLTVRPNVIVKPQRTGDRLTIKPISNYLGHLRGWICIGRRQSSSHEVWQATSGCLLTHDSILKQRVQWMAASDKEQKCAHVWFIFGDIANYCMYCFHFLSNKAWNTSLNHPEWKGFELSWRTALKPNCELNIPCTKIWSEPTLNAGILSLAAAIVPKGLLK